MGGKRDKGAERRQAELLEQQQKQLAEQEAAAKAAADAAREDRVSQQKRLRGRLSGNRSLIKTSELGVSENLG